MIKVLGFILLVVGVAFAAWSIAALFLSMALAHLATTTPLPALDWSSCMWLLVATTIMGGAFSTTFGVASRSKDK